MQLIDVSSFRNWAEQRGMIWDQASDRPMFGGTENESPWPWPKRDGCTSARELADLALDTVRAASLSDSGGFYLWPPGGVWGLGWAGPFPGCANVYAVRDAILRGLGIWDGFSGAAYFEKAEAPSLAAAIFARCFMIDDCLGDSTDDSFVYPSHGWLYLHFDDEEICWGMASDAAAVRAFDAELGHLEWGWLRDKARNHWSWHLPDLA